MRKMFKSPPKPRAKTVRRKRVLNNNNYSNYINERYVNVAYLKIHLLTD